MSVSLVLLPVALAMRVVMGEKNFESWVKAQQRPLPTNISSESELRRVVEGAGYDLKRIGGLLKTHIRGEQSFLFWEYGSRGWVAVFSRHDREADVEKFVKAIERYAAREVFVGYATAIQEGPKQFPTNIIDAATLKEVLLGLGATPIVRSDGSIHCRVEGTKLLFTKTGDGPFVVEISSPPGLEKAYQYLDSIDEDYKRAVQSATYEKVKNRAKASGMVVESEQVLDDKTIVLTLLVS